MASNLTFLEIFHSRKGLLTRTRHFGDPRLNLRGPESKCQEKEENMVSIVLVCGRLCYTSHKPVRAGVYKYRITSGPWFDRA